MTIKFSKEWTPNLAYLVGLIVTDGCLSSDGRHIIFTSRDIDLIKTFKSILNSNNKIGTTKNKNSWAYRIQIGNVELFHWLQSIGINPRKSLNIGSVNVPDEYFIDFLRGHLDGDGSITTYIDKSNVKKSKKYVYRRLWVRFISGSAKHIEWLHNKISVITGLNGRVHQTKKNSVGNRLNIIKFAKKESIQILKKIYYSKNLPCLKRKRKVANEFLYS